MLFTSYTFFLFLALFYLGWRYLPNRRIALINSFSLVFYGAWNPYYILLILYSAVIDFYFAQAIARDRTRGRLYVQLSLLSNLGLLGFFKYFNFFRDSWCDMAGFFGGACQYSPLEIILPVGISFYTFQTLAYTIDVYRGKIEPTHNFPQYLCYVSFFPQLIAGPIERAGRLLPQIAKVAAGKSGPIAWRPGFSLIFRGLFKKVVIAGNLAPYVDTVYDSMSLWSPTSLLIATVFFSVQIYCDFSGYSDIARGLARTLGIELMQNFNYPYAAASIREFWQRWHISLSTWLRDYLYIPLGGSRKGTFWTKINLIITMTLGGLWHGASYHFIAWGVFHGGAMALERFVATSPLGRFALPRPVKWFITFCFIQFGYFLFRMDSISDLRWLLWILRDLPARSAEAFLTPNIMQITLFTLFWTVTLVEGGVFRRRWRMLESVGTPARMAFLGAGALLYYLFAPAMDQVFIYFQF